MGCPERFASYRKKTRGKRADLILVSGNFLTNVSDLRKVTKTVANGRMYDTGKLWESVGFRPASSLQAAER